MQAYDLVIIIRSRVQQILRLSLTSGDRVLACAETDSLRVFYGSDEVTTWQLWVNSGQEILRRFDEVNDKMSEIVFVNY